MPERYDGPSVDLTRREAIGRLALFGTVMAILQSRAYAQNGAYSNSAIALPDQLPVFSSEDDLVKAVKIARAVRSGPSVITRDATVAEMDHRGTMTVLRQGNNGWICTPFDQTSPPIPIGPHWRVLWPFDSTHCGLPTTVRDAGAWIMFAGTPYAYLHICGTPWDGNEYTPGDEARWGMQYAKPGIVRTQGR